jgi:MurNAc alpha-1-phosphate uridylyltransferase
MTKLTLHLENQAAMACLAADLACFLPHNVTLTLAGDLGAGKTFFAQCFLRALGVTQPVNSPTFQIAAFYDTTRGRVWHYDLYRLKDPHELAEIGLFDAYHDLFTLIEWPDRLGAYTPRARVVNITIDFVSNQQTARKVTLDFADVLDMPTTAFIYAAGFGERMRPLTLDTPKPLIKVNGQPILAYILGQCLAAGLKRVVVNTHYLGQQIEDFLAQYRDRIEIILSHEDHILDTGGGLKQALPLFADQVFFALNGDSLLCDGPGLPAMIRMALKYRSDMDILLLLQKVGQGMITPGRGDYHMMHDRLTRAIDRKGDYMFTGARIVHRRVFEATPDGPFLFLQCMDRAQNLATLYGMVHDGEWHHLSTPDDVQLVSDHLKKLSNQSAKVVP